MSIYAANLAVFNFVKLICSQDGEQLQADFKPPIPDKQRGAFHSST